MAVSLYEDWGTNGTAGNWGWQFAGVVPSIGTTDGTVGLIGWEGVIGTAYLPAPVGTWGWTEGTYSWRVYTGTTAHGPYVILGQNAGGTSLGLGLSRGRGNDYAEIYNGTIIFSSSVTYNDGQIWTQVDVPYSDGTFRGTFRNGSGTLVRYYEGFYRDEDTPPVVQICSFGTSDDLHNFDWIDYPAVDQVPETILDFVGTYGEYPIFGTRPLGDYVMAISDVRQQVYEPNNTRGWMSSVNVTLDNSTGEWGTIAGYTGTAGDPTWSLGTFFVRQTWDDGTNWTNMLTGYVRPEKVVYDYGNETVQLRVDSVLGRAAKKLIPYDPQWLGTVDSIGAGTAEGTITVSRTGSTYDIYEREYLWEGTGTTGLTIKVDGLAETGTWVPDGATYTAIYYLREKPDWMIVGGSVYRSESSGRWDQQVTGIDEIGDGMGIDFSKSRWEAQLIGMYTFKPDAKRYYGGEPWIDVMHDYTASLGMSYSLNGDGNGVIHMPFPDVGTSGTVDFRDAVNSGWTLKQVASLKSVQVKTEYNQLDSKWDGESIAEQDSVSEGQALKIEAPWLESDRYGHALAYRTLAMTAYPLDRLSLTMEGSVWLTYDPSDVIALSNCPLANLGGKMMLAGKTYNYEEDLTTLDLIEQRTFGVFRFDHSEWGGSDLWW